MKKLLVITASGNATRLRPLTSNMSKSMLPVNGKPVIAYILDATIDKYDHVVVVHNTNTDVPQFVSTAYSSKMSKISFVRQEEQIGVLYAAYLGCVAAPNTDEYSLTVWLGDTIVTDYDTDGIKNELVVSEVHDYERWCMVGQDETNVCTFYDKPSDPPPTRHALVGIYTFTNAKKFEVRAEHILSRQERVKGEYQMSQILEEYSVFDLIKTVAWYDCGDFPSLYQSKARLLTGLTRDDNRISIDIGRSSVSKSGTRCIGERAWYQRVNENYRYALPYIPQLYNYDVDWYEIAYCSGTTLQEIFAFENLRDDTTKYTIESVMHAWYSAFMYEPHLTNKDNFRKLLFTERIERVSKYDFTKYDFITQEDLDLYCDYVKKTYDELPDLLYVQEPGHGDLHFGNVIFDYNLGSTKFIDPKGPTTIPYLYDVAKFYQSVYGDYLWIKTNTQVNEHLKDVIIKTIDDYMGYTIADMGKKLVPVLMGSILDFHKDAPEHQKKIWQKTIQLIKQ